MSHRTTLTGEQYMGEYQDVLQDMWAKTYRTQNMIAIL